MMRETCFIFLFDNFKSSYLMWLLPTFDKSGDIYNPKLGEFFNKEMIISMYCSLNFYSIFIYISTPDSQTWMVLFEDLLSVLWNTYFYLIIYCTSHKQLIWKVLFRLFDISFLVMADLPESRRVSELESHDMPGNVSDCRYSFIRWLAHFVFISKQQDKAIEKSVTNPGSSYSAI